MTENQMQLDKKIDLMKKDNFKKQMDYQLYLKQIKDSQEKQRELNERNHMNDKFNQNAFNELVKEENYQKVY